MSSQPESEIAAKLKEIREALALSQGEMARKLAITDQTYGRYERGEREAPAGLLSRLVSIGVSPRWLLADVGPIFGRAGGEEEGSGKGFGELAPLPLEGRRIDEAGFVLVPRYDVKASAGGGTLYEEQNLLGSIAFRREWLHKALHVNPADLLVVEASGDSMPGIADDGALLLLDRSEPVFRGDGAYVFVVDGLLLVKNLRLLLDGSLEVTSADEIRSTKDLIARRDLEKVRIIGRVIWKAGKA